ncbi:MAG: hypothetical protein JWO00_330 [Candidatus Parcubacteria bacterium]|nr:hypothetical protein [Candidatus Parcubacteria bacterium]
MKNTVIKMYAAIGTALTVLALSFVVAAFPAQAHAYVAYGGNGNSYPCPHPYTYPNGYYYCGTPATNTVPPPQPYPYPQPQPQYQNLGVSCYAANSSVSTGQSVQWNAYASGGTGSYSYSWSGTDGLYGSGSTAYMTYYNPGYKTATVSVYSGGQTVTVSCSGSVNVYDSYNNGYYYQQNTYTYPTVVSSNASGLQVGCYSDPATASINQPVTWNVEVTGGMAPYTYSWTGSDGLTGSNATAIKYYQSAGTKSAIVSVTSADGRSTTWACSNTVSVRSGYVAPKPTKPVVQAPQPTPVQTDLGANSIFSLNNVPWGWVAVLVILVLFAAVMYLTFNKTKI